MASVVFNKCLSELFNGNLDLAADDIRVALLMTNTTADTNEDAATLSALTLDEQDGTNYVRKALTTETVTQDDTNDLAKFDADDVTWTALGAGTRNTQGALVYKHVTNDSDSIPLFFVDFGNQVVHTGADYTLVWNSSNGIATIQQG